MKDFHLDDNQIQAYLDGLLDQDQRESVVLHLRCCNRCQSRVSVYQDVMYALERDWAPQLSETTRANIVRNACTLIRRQRWLSLSVRFAVYGVGVFAGLMVSLPYINLTDAFGMMWPRSLSKSLESMSFVIPEEMSTLFSGAEVKLVGFAIIVLALIALCDQLFHHKKTRVVDFRS